MDEELLNRIRVLEAKVEYLRKKLKKTREEFHETLDEIGRQGL